MKKLAAITLILALMLPLAVACGNTEPAPEASAAPETSTAPETSAVPEAPEVPEEPEEAEEPFAVYETDEEIYMANLGEFYEHYQNAMAAENVSERHALLAVAEAKALEASTGAPMYGPAAGYSMTRQVFRSSGYAPWRGGMSGFGDYILTNEILTTADYARTREIWNETVGTGTYIEKVREYLTGAGYTFSDTVVGTFVDNPTTWNIFTAATSNDSTLIYPTTDYLFVYGPEGELVPHLAESYEISPDGMTYTIKIRQGMSWVDSQGRKVADITADDWVAAAQHQADVQDVYTLNLYVAGMTAYATGETTDFSTVGIKAVDDHTLQYTLNQPCTYFHTMFHSNEFLPLCRSYFLSQGGAFGIAEYAAASASSGYTYGIDQNHIPYCGQFLCTNMTEKNSVNYVLNESYWNAPNCTLTKVSYIYDDGSDVSRAYDNFLNGVTTYMYLRTAQIEIAKQNGDFDKYAVVTDVGRATFLFWFNLHRQTYANMADGAGASMKTDAEKELSRAAFQNKHFRLALNYAIDRETFMSVNYGEDLKATSLRNTMTPGTYVSLAEEVTIDINGEATTFPAGTWYGEILQAQLTADGFPIDVWDEENITTDGFAAWYRPDLAAQELAIAIEELKSIGYEVSAENPIVIDYPHVGYNENGQNQAYVLKTSIEAALGDCVRFDLIPLNNATEFLNVQSNTTCGAEHNTDMGGLGAIGSDHGDPQCYTEALLPYGDGYLTPKMGLW